MRICVIGAGYVGLVSATCLADMGNEVICVDNDKEKIEGLKKHIVPIYEPGLDDLITKNMRAKRLFFTSDTKEGIHQSNVIFIAVGTPCKEDGTADLSSVEAVAKEVASETQRYKVIVQKSTVPVMTGKWIRDMMKSYDPDGVSFDVVSNPEFLREGCAITDFMHPDRIVIGAETEKAKGIMRKLYEPLNVPIIFTNIESAELIKYASNSFLAMKISYINAIASICEKVGADVVKVADGMGYDTRIGRGFLNAGVGFGGSCFPKDLSAFIKTAEQIGYDFELLKEVEKLNRAQRELILQKAKELLGTLKGRTIGVLGLAFKPNTDDLREAPAIDIIEKLKKEGAKIKTYDPVAMEKAKAVLRDVQFCKNAYDAADGSDALVIATEWAEFKTLDLGKIKDLLKHPNVIDGRNIYEPQEMKHLGFNYRGVGR
jgi:UDPglucose 6-dehydrogenase